MAHSLEQYKQAFANARRPPGESSDLAQTREAALSRFLTLGFPTTRDEEWRFTSVAPIAERAFALAQTSPAARHRDIAPLRSHDAFGAELVFVDGRLAPALSTADALPRGVRVGSLADVTAGHAEGIASHLARVAQFDRRPFVAFNTAFFADGA